MNPPPVNVVDIENAYLGALMRDGLKPFIPLKPSDFFEPRNADVYAVILALDNEGINCDELVVCKRLREERSTVNEHYVNGLLTSLGFTLFNEAWAASIKNNAQTRYLELQLKNGLKSIQQGESSKHVKEGLERTLRDIQDAEELPKGVEVMPLDKLRVFDRHNDPDCMIGRRWLCKGGSLLIVGQSGVGKSSMMIQMAISWAAGKSFFGIKSQVPRRVLVIQGENDQGDIAEGFQDVRAGFSDWSLEDESTLNQNLNILRVNEKTGEEFADILKAKAVEHAAEFVFVDPLLSYASGNISSTEDMSFFLRKQIAPVLKGTGIVLVAIHHTGKPGNPDDKANKTVTDNSYEGIGSSEITNFFRAVMVLSRAEKEEPVFRLLISKRRGRAGLMDRMSEMTDTVYLAHSRKSGEVKWEYATPEQTKKLTNKKSKNKGY